MEACYNIFRILTIFKVVLSGGPIIRKKKKEGDRINCLRSTYKSPHCFHVSMFPERERAVRGRPSVPGSGPDGISKDMTCHLRTWYYGLLILV